MPNSLKTELINYIKRYGKVVTARELKTKEVLMYNFSVHEFDFHLKKAQQKYVDEKIGKYLNEIIKIIEILHTDRNSRRAILQFRMDEEIPECVANIHFLIREDRLWTIVSQRSIDVENNLETDIMIAKKMSDMICEQLKVELQLIKFNVNSFHIYLKEEEDNGNI